MVDKRSPHAVTIQSSSLVRAAEVATAEAGEVALAGASRVISVYAGSGDGAVGDGT